jgi:putative MATE family efflux protein
MGQPMPAQQGRPPNEAEREPFLLVSDPEPRFGLAHFAVDSVLAKHILHVALPVVAGMLTQTAINILDTVMVGRLPSEIANPGQAAIGRSLPIMWAVGGFLSAVWVGTQAITSRRAGEGKHLLAGRALTNSLLLSFSSGVVFVVASILLTRPLLGLLVNDASVIELGTGYLRIRLVGVLAMACTFSYKSFFDGIGRTKVFMTVAVTMNVLNVILNYILIFGVESLGIPSLAVDGAAYASVISAYIGLFMLVAVSFMPRFLGRYHYYNPHNINGTVAREIVRLSLPNGLATIVVMLGFVAFYWVVGIVNDQYALPGNPVVETANQVMITLMMVSFMSSLAFGTATAAVVSQSLGASRPYLAERYGWDAAKLWAYVLTAYGVLMVFVPDELLWLVNPDIEVIGVAREPLQTLGALQAIIAIGMVLAQTLYGVGNAKFVLLVEFCLHLLVMSPAAYLFGVVLDFGLIGVYVGPTLYASLLAAAMYWKFTRGDWKEIRI